MQNIIHIISEVLCNLLPQHLVKLITPKLVQAIERSGYGDKEGAVSTVLLE